MNYYKISRDYEELWNLINGGNKIVCWADYKTHDRRDTRDICELLKYDKIASILVHGQIALNAPSKDEFINQCKSANIEFIVPSNK